MMKKQKRKSKIIKRTLRWLFFFFLCIILVFFINQNIIFKPFLIYDGHHDLNVICKNWINNHMHSLFITKKSLLNIETNSIDKTISSLKIKRKFFLVWSIGVKQKIASKYISINGEIRSLNDEFDLIDIPINQKEIQKEIPFLLKIELLNQLPIKKGLNDNESKKNQNIGSNDVNIKTEIDLFQTYQNDIKPFVRYLYETESSLGPKITLIQFFPTEGIRFFLYEKIYWIGKTKEFVQTERKIEECEQYLKLKNKFQSYNEFDLRYENRIICRNNQ